MSDGNIVDFPGGKKTSSAPPTEEAVRLAHFCSANSLLEYKWFVNITSDKSISFVCSGCGKIYFNAATANDGSTVHPEPTKAG